MERGTLGQGAHILNLFKETSQRQIDCLIKSGLLADLRDANIEQIDRHAFRKICGLSILLRFISETNVPGVKRFAIKDHIQKANIRWIGYNFRCVMLEKIEENVPAGELVIHNLEKKSLNVPILAELGKCAEISLAHFFELIRNQAKGQEGPLLTKGYTNIAYIRGTDRNLWAVVAGWSDFGQEWRVDANSVKDRYAWNERCQVISRKWF